MLSVFCPTNALAKRVAPKDVPPIVADGVRYSAEGDGRDSFVVATEEASGKASWSTKMFHTRIKLWREEDNQWLFISDMKTHWKLSARPRREKSLLLDFFEFKARKERSVWECFSSPRAKALEASSLCSADRLFDPV
jgi:hypothetical protein